MAIAFVLVISARSPSGPSHNLSEIPSRTIVEWEIVAYDINCPVVDVKWAKSQPNRNVWTCITFLSKKNYILINKLISIAFVLVVRTRSWHLTCKLSFVCTYCKLPLETSDHWTRTVKLLWVTVELEICITRHDLTI